MLYYRNIAKFPITCDGVKVAPGEIHETNHYINNKYMFRVEQPKVEVIEPVIEVAPIKEEKTVATELIPEVKTEEKFEVLSVLKPKQTRRRSTKTTNTNKNINKEINSEDIDNG